MLPTLDEFKQAQQRIAALLSETPLERSTRLSNHFKADVYLKREDLQQVRSYKIEVHTTNSSPSLNMKMLNALSAPVQEIMPKVLP